MATTCGRPRVPFGAARAHHRRALGCREESGSPSHGDRSARRTVEAGARRLRPSRQAARGPRITTAHSRRADVALRRTAHGQPRSRDHGLTAPSRRVRAAGAQGGRACVIADNVGGAASDDAQRQPLAGLLHFAALFSNLKVCAETSRPSPTSSLPPRGTKSVRRRSSLSASSAG